ncbi:MAG: flagellar protein export ATPase FliI [Alphaproteobacteria bacterium]|nr:flagellar protein export ATPase FliI [Alphaproteobacteria bacterium]
MGCAGIDVEGRVTGLSGLAVDIGGLAEHVAIGDRVTLHARDHRKVTAEIIGFAGTAARAMAFGATDGIGPGVRVTTRLNRAGGVLHVDDGWVGRVIDPLGQPLDRRGALARGPVGLSARTAPPEATGRARLGPRIDLGVRALNAFTTCRDGQRLGLFAGSGVGKSTLLSMLARHTDCDVAVLALVGERGREVREFLEDDLGAEGLARSVVVVATSDMPPLMRREAAYTAMTVAEHFRDAGKKVLLLMDSVTRYCLALREIGLSAGEPPATRGYPPSVFAELPRLLERAGPGPDLGESTGRITAFFTVLVEGDDHNEPIADAVRGILDGHVVLDRRIAEGGRYPAIDVLRSLSRAVPGCNTETENALTRRARRILALYADAVDIVRLGAHRPGADPEVDEAIRLAPRIEEFLRQTRDEASNVEVSFQALAEAMDEPIRP